MKASTILFLLGLLLEIVAFFGAQAENIPSILNFILPKYKNALTGLETLESNEALLPQEKGFNELHEIILNVLKQKNDPHLLVGISVIKITRKGARLRIGKKSAGEVVPLEIELSNNQNINWELEILEKEVERLKSIGLFKYSKWIFIAGILMIIGAFFIKSK